MTHLARRRGSHRAARATARVAAWLACVSIAGCGWHLRSWDFGDAFAKIYISTDDSVDVGAELSRAFRASGVTVVEAPTDADVVVTLADQQQSRRGVSVTNAARTAEYEVAFQLRFSAREADGGELVPERVLRVQRVYRLDRSNIVGSSEEETLLAREMRTEVVQGILRSLGTAANAKAVQA